MARTYYDVLGVSQSASKSVIKTASREKAKLVHPDTVQAHTANLGSYAAERLKATLEQDFRELTEAYEVLSDSQKRKEYDDFLQQMQAASAPPDFTPPPSQATSTPPTANFCTDCGAQLVGNRCPLCEKRRVSVALFSGAQALIWVPVSIFAVFVAVTLPKAWDANTCGSILTILGIIVVFTRGKLWGGIKRLCKTHPKVGGITIEAAALVVLSLMVGVFNKPPSKTASTPAQTQTASVVPMKPTDCHEMVITHSVEIGPHTYSVGRRVCVTSYYSGKYFDPQKNEWFNESDLEAVKPIDQIEPTKVDAKPKPPVKTVPKKSQQKPFVSSAGVEDNKDAPSLSDRDYYQQIFDAGGFFEPVQGVRMPDDSPLMVQNASHACFSDEHHSGAFFTILARAYDANFIQATRRGLEAVQKNDENEQSKQLAILREIQKQSPYIWFLNIVEFKGLGPEDQQFYRSGGRTMFVTDYEKGREVDIQMYHWDGAAWSPDADPDADTHKSAVFQISIDPSTMRYVRSMMISTTIGNGVTAVADERHYGPWRGVCEKIPSPK